MTDEDMPKERFIDELGQLRRRITELEKLEREYQRVEKKLRRQNEYLAALHETTLALMNRLELADLLEAIVTRAGQLLDTTHGFIYLAKPGHDEFELKVGVGAFSQQISLCVKPGEGLGGKVWQTEQPLVVDDYDSWSGRSPSFGYRIVRAAIGVPLKSGPQVAGVIGLAYDYESGQIFGDEEIELLNRFAQLASIALDNARLYTAAQEELKERKQAEAELQRAKEAAEAATRVKSALLANIGHELRTPLNAIIGYSEFLQEAQDMSHEEIVRDLQRIKMAGSHLLKIINDILDLSKIEAGQMPLFVETFEVSVLINDLVAAVQPLIKKNNNTLELYCADNLGTMRADLVKIRHALLNLLNNAAKFTEQGKIVLNVNRETPPVTLLTEEVEEWLSFRVTDTGIGMSTEQMDHAFQPFTQADVSINRKYSGTGLGLAISRRFCQMMGGDITVVSQLGHGSTFTILLPAEAPETMAEATFLV